MNCIELFVQEVKARPNEMALCIPGQETATFDELFKVAKQAQSLYLSLGVGPNTPVLLLDGLSTRLYGSIIGLLSLGATVVLVEPWMPVAKIHNSIQLIRPKFFVSNNLGFLWGARVKAIRDISKWIPAKSIEAASSTSTFHLENVPANTPGIITFTSGTTGNPKGVIRNQGYLIKQHEVLSSYIGQTHDGKPISGPDLCIFANFVLCNLASGRGSVIIPPGWSPKILKGLESLPSHFQPQTLTAGPAFLMELMKYSNLQSLSSFHIGGALTDCWIFEEAFKKWPNAHWSHIYGGSEAEPVALVDAREAVTRSRNLGHFQTLCLGKNVAEIKPKVEASGLWVAGPHVCPEYLGNDGENKLYKRKDSDGTLWHFMGDRIVSDEHHHWWYGGRSGQSFDDFQLEQKIYQEVQSSKSFIKRRSRPGDGRVEKWLVGEGIKKRKNQLLKTFPELSGVVEAKIYRDRRHRARIDRTKTLQKGAKWLDG